MNRLDSLDELDAIMASVAIEPNNAHQTPSKALPSTSTLRTPNQPSTSPSSASSSDRLNPSNVSPLPTNSVDQSAPPIAPSSSCNRCGGVIIDDLLERAGKLYHMHHFTCRSCDVFLDTSFVQLDGDAYCKSCAESVMICFYCSKSIEGVSECGIGNCISI